MNPVLGESRMSRCGVRTPIFGGLSAACRSTPWSLPPQAKATTPTAPGGDAHSPLVRIGFRRSHGWGLALLIAAEASLALLLSPAAVAVTVTTMDGSATGGDDSTPGGAKATGTGTIVNDDRTSGQFRR